MQVGSCMHIRPMVDRGITICFCQRFRQRARYGGDLRREYRGRRGFAWSGNGSFAPRPGEGSEDRRQYVGNIRPVPWNPTEPTLKEKQ